jgi:hypothetical protein
MIAQIDLAWFSIVNMILIIVLVFKVSQLSRRLAVLMQSGRFYETISKGTESEGSHLKDL